MASAASTVVRVKPARDAGRPSLSGQQTAELYAVHAFVWILRRGHYELGIDANPALGIQAAFTDLARAI
jgi:hypothetical protein